jgi:hypothetical protein
MEATEIIAIVGGILTIMGVLVAALMWYVRVVVRDEVMKATKPIQPGYRNHGESLADVAHIVKRIADKIGLED